jgi:hypothetical protein
MLYLLASKSLSIFVASSIMTGGIMKLSVRLFLLSLIIFAKLSWGGESSGLVTYIYVHTPNILMFQAGTQNAPAG